MRESLHQEHDLRVGSGVVVVMGLNVAGGVWHTGLLQQSRFSFTNLQNEGNDVYFGHLNEKIIMVNKNSSFFRGFILTVNIYLHLWFLNLPCISSFWPYTINFWPLSSKNVYIYIYIKTKHFFMEIIIYTFKQSVAKIIDGTTVFVSCKT